jgi:hypothetical protein
MRSMTSSWSMSETMRISREHFVGLPHLLDQLAPLLRRDAARRHDFGSIALEL